jgi:endonuclease/exonuclease/phosphatase family metal-dependent hydrolase
VLDQSEQSQRVRVVTQNLWARFGVWHERRAVLVEGLRELRPDIVAFQEAIKTEGYDQVVDLLGSDYHVAHHSNREADGSGSSIASRWPLAAVHELDLRLTPRTAGFPCGALIAEIEIPDAIGTLLFVNHKPNFQSPLEYERELQAVTTARFVEKLVRGRDLHVVLAGDQDAVPEAVSIRFWSGRQSVDGTSVCYRDAWESAHPHDSGPTFVPQRNPLVNSENWPGDVARRIDYVFVRCRDHGPTLRIAGCEQIFDEPL